MDGVSERGGHPVIRKVISFTNWEYYVFFPHSKPVFLCFESSHEFYSDIVYYQAADEAMDAEDYCVR